ncbi:hypothetical protein I8751_18580 [Nostocaceae cyanobacterium CENA357]|uniref:Uncharacterized protein n=1 Tax=Atlanticothrix silvestris CENA357 TaxID=1725252 RepID=A0A8J7L3T9_9CYAN|nr:hypothetical protein [Atlanticothrix silvestris]MBH8554334.1 hypothetical protein [Atlanticothrix silvestris CENA357]
MENVPTDASINEKYLIQSEGKTSIAVTISLLFSIFAANDTRGAAIPIYGNI